jgi:hypothetical protein
MKRGYQFTTIKVEKPKNQKKTPKSLSAANIAQRYLELRKLRQQLSEAEAWRRTQ